MNTTIFFYLLIAAYSLIVLLCASQTGLIHLPQKQSGITCVHKNRIKIDSNQQKNKIFRTELAIFGISVYLNLVLGILTTNGDSAHFIHVTSLFTESAHPFAGFYAKGQVTYPPLFNYIYFIIAQLLRLSGISFDHTPEAFILAVKLPGILCEFLMAWMLYRYAKEHLDEGQTIPVLLLTLLNPAFLFLTAYICQIDALYVCFMLLCILLICRRQLKTSYFVFAAAVLCKFQAVFITPVIFYATFREVFLHDFRWKKFCTHLSAGLAAIGCMLLCYLPFVWDFSAGAFYHGGILINFTSSVKGYGWASQNTYNFWTLAGYNLRQDTQLFGPLPCVVWGAVFLVLLVLLSGYYFWKGKDDISIYPMTGALLVSGTVCFSTRMMPRYLYAAIPLLIFGFLLRPCCRTLLCAVGFTAALFLLNVYDYVLFPSDCYTPYLLLPKLLSACMLCCFGFLNVTIRRLYL